MSDILVEKDEIQGIKIYRFLKNNRNAVDQYLALIDADAYTHEVSVGAEIAMTYVIDVSKSGMYPVTYMRQVAVPMMAKHDNFPKNYIAYIVDNPNDSILVDMVSAITARELDNTRKIFQTEQMDEAIEWLSSVRQQENGDS